jgi:RNA polymerase sigma factor (sigma-70 family)
MRNETPLDRIVPRLRRGPVAWRATELPDALLLRRFADGRDEAAFEALVRRHGGLVWGVCRRALGHEQDAEDAFQATFLVLARQAASIRQAGSVVSWLHGTARRLCLRAKRDLARRHRHEGRAGRPEAAGAEPGPALWELQVALDEEVRRLPEKERAVFTLCVLEGIDRPVAARRLGYPLGTISVTLWRARLRLRRQLARRGVAFTAALTATSLASVGTAAVPRRLLAAGVTTALGRAEAVPVRVGALAEGIGRGVNALRRTVAALLVTVAVVVAGLGGDRQPAPPAAAPVASTPAPDADRPVAREVGGRVLDPDGKPVAGAKLAFASTSARAMPDKVWATSAADGRFRFTVAPKDVDQSWSETPFADATVIAAAPGFGVALARVGDHPSPADLTLQLVPDDVPIQGRVIDLQGQPVAGVTVRVETVHAPRQGDLTPWLDSLKANAKSPGSVARPPTVGAYTPAFDNLIPPATTGPDGRFRITGVGRERIAGLRIEGPTVVSRRVNAVTRRAADGLPQGPEETYHPSAFDHLVAPTKPVVGVVRDKDTRRPIPGVRVQSYRVAGKEGFDQSVHTTTDAEGRFRLVGLPKGRGNELLVNHHDEPYLDVVQPFDDTPGLEPVAVEIRMKRGVWVRGRITDKATGRPIWASVEYFAFNDNPHLHEFGRPKDTSFRSTDEHGVFRTAVMPGRGLIGVKANHDHYVRGAGAETIKGADGRLAMFRTSPYFVMAVNYHALVEIAPEPGSGPVVCDVALDRGRSVKGTVLGADGKPLAGARAFGLAAFNSWADPPLTEAGFTVSKLTRGEHRLLLFAHGEKRLAGHAEVGPDTAGPLTVRLEPWGTLTGRVLKPDGEPLRGVEVSLSARATPDGLGHSVLPRRVEPGPDGAFRIEGLAPGLTYSLSVVRRGYVLPPVGAEVPPLTLKAGETKDLGGLRVNPNVN